MWQPGTTLEGLEREAIETAFRFYEKNKTATAQALGISIRTLDARLETYAGKGRASNDPGLQQGPASPPHGLRPDQVSPERSVSMREREEVQEMPRPTKGPANHNTKPNKG